MYQALYRKYRPQTFDDVIGQKHITDTLKKQVETGHLSHAYIFIGTRGTGKTTCARILARAVNCENPVNGNPCCKCDSCRGILDGSIMDIVELDAASNNGVDNVRALREEAVFSPANVKKRVYIIDEVHMLSTAAFNALLKIIEEPPEHLIFILATTELQKVPATILSRCQRHSFKRIDIDVLSNYICTIAEKENLKITKEAARLLAGLGEGSVRDTLSLLDQCATYENIDVDTIYTDVGLAGNKRIMNLFESIMEKSIEDSLSQLNSLWHDGKDISTILKELSGLCRDILIYKMAPKSASKLIYSGYDIKDIENLSARFSPDSLISTLNSLQRATENLKDKLDQKVVAEMCIANICYGFVSTQPTSEAVKLETVNEKPIKSPIKNEINVMSANVAVSNVVHVQEKDDVRSNVNETDDCPFKENKQADEESGEKNIIKSSSSSDWEAIKENLKSRLPGDLRVSINNIAGIFDGMFLELNIGNEFLYNRFNKPEITEVIETVATQIMGTTIKVRYKQGTVNNDKPNRELDELKKYSEFNWR